ncbi:MAG: hypothetical protein GC134_07940 [Proteobacteria bacterium]|nr:hypothetical protein [Pseudomonadota bacterium]
MTAQVRKKNTFQSPPAAPALRVAAHGGTKPAGTFAHLGALWRTLRYLRPVQILARLDYRARVLYYKSFLYPFIEYEDHEIPEKPLFNPPHLWRGNAELGKALAKYTFLFLDRPVNMDKKVQWEPQGVSTLWLYNLHYFQWLADLRATDTEEARQTAREMVRDWIENCGTFHPLRWHPYPLSLRLVSWLTHAEWLLEGADGGWRKDFMTSLSQQADHMPRVLEWDVGGNHLIKNLKALAYTGLCLPGRQSTYLEAVSLLKEQLDLQILPDGAHYELSPHYHADVLEDLLDIHALMLKANQVPPQELDDAIDRMAVTLAFYRHPDGGLALFNDGAVGDVDHIDDLLERCGGLGGKLPRQLPYAGYVRLQKKGFCVLMDTGKCCPDDLPAHAHADTLSFELSVGDERVFVNSGTYAYQHELRNTFRGTAAHNTAVVAGTDSAEVWDNFRLGRRPRKVEFSLREEPNTGIGVEAWHDGYKYMGAKHTRRLFLNEEGTDLRGEDVIDSKTEYPVTVHFHLHPDVKYKLTGDHTAELTTARGTKLVFRAKGGRLYDIDSQYAPQFGRSTPTRQLVLRGTWEGGKCQMLWGIKNK